MSEGAPPAGHGKHTMIPGIPNWLTAVGGGLAIGVVYLIYKGHKTQAAQTAAQGSLTASGQLPAYGQPAGDTIVPVNQGITDNQMTDLLAAIESLQGPPSVPPPRKRHKVHNGGRSCDGTDKDGCPWADDDTDQGGSHSGQHKHHSGGSGCDGTDSDSCPWQDDDSGSSSGGSGGGWGSSSGGDGSGSGGGWQGGGGDQGNGSSGGGSASDGGWSGGQGGQGSQYQGGGSRGGRGSDQSRRSGGRGATYQQMQGGQ